jgi:hypothetical protein
VLFRSDDIHDLDRRQRMIAAGQCRRDPLCQYSPIAMTAAALMNQWTSSFVVEVHDENNNTTEGKCENEERRQ